jgi:hypothetical protein
MTATERIRAYLPEPVLAAFALSVSINIFGKVALANFMHSEARDVLSLLTVLLGASLALWVGLFWISNSEFGKWLSSRGALQSTNAAYITSVAVLMAACVFCILCAYLSPAYLRTQLSGMFIGVYGLLTVPTMLNNTRMLLDLHGAFGKQRSTVTDIRPGSYK